MASINLLTKAGKTNRKKKKIKIKVSGLPPKDAPWGESSHQIIWLRKPLTGEARRGSRLVFSRFQIQVSWQPRLVTTNKGKHIQVGRKQSPGHVFARLNSAEYSSRCGVWTSWDHLQPPSELLSLKKVGIWYQANLGMATDEATLLFISEKASYLRESSERKNSQCTQCKDWEVLLSRGQETGVTSRTSSTADPLSNDPHPPSLPL